MNSINEKFPFKINIPWPRPGMQELSFIHYTPEVSRLLYCLLFKSRQGRLIRKAGFLQSSFTRYYGDNDLFQSSLARAGQYFIIPSERQKLMPQVMPLISISHRISNTFY